MPLRNTEAKLVCTRAEPAMSLAVTLPLELSTSSEPRTRSAFTKPNRVSTSSLPRMSTAVTLPFELLIRAAPAILRTSIGAKLPLMSAEPPMTVASTRPFVESTVRLLWMFEIDVDLQDCDRSVRVLHRGVAAGILDRDRPERVLDPLRPSTIAEQDRSLTVDDLARRAEPFDFDASEAIPQQQRRTKGNRDRQIGGI